MRHTIAKSAMVCLLAAPAAAPTEVNAETNVLIFLADDLGYGDLGYSGSTHARTPHIDAFAQQNMTFTAGYAPSPQCSPTRAAILTGQYPARLHITTWIGGKNLAQYKGMSLPVERKRLPDDTHTLAHHFQSRGYDTVQIGKWHLGGNSELPARAGFDETIGFAPNAGPGTPKEWFGPYPKIKDLTGPPDEYITDRLTDEAVEYLDEVSDRPFFMMLQHYDVHAPLVAPEEDVQKYVDAGRPRDTDSENATYLAMKENLDDSFGRVMAALEDNDLADDTIVVFFSDNGGTPWHARNDPLSGGKKRFTEGGIRVPLVIRVPGVTEPGSVSDVAVNGIDFFPTLVELTGGSVSEVDHLFDGISIAPLLRGGDTLDREALFWHHPAVSRDYAIIPPQGVVRQGPWKLIHYYGDTQPAELYHLGDDLGETKNLADRFPERVAEMQNLLEKHLDHTDAQRVPAR